MRHCEMRCSVCSLIPLACWHTTGKLAEKTCCRMCCTWQALTSSCLPTSTRCAKLTATGAPIPRYVLDLWGALGSLQAPCLVQGPIWQCMHAV